MRPHRSVEHGSDIEILQPPGTFALTPASRVSLEAIARHRGLLRGIGLDWGTGSGCLAIAAARLSSVERVVGLEIDEENVAIARENARINGVEGKVEVLLSDSYEPLTASGRSLLRELCGRVSFILANPPASDDDDGFGFRRAVLRGAARYLVDGGVVFLSISSQYGARRIANLTAECPGFRREGVLASSDRVPFDLGRDDLLRCLELYAVEEGRGGLAYEFRDPDSAARLDARAARALFRDTGRSPLSRWQTHLFRFQGPGGSADSSETPRRS